MKKFLLVKLFLGIRRMQFWHAFPKYKNRSLKSKKLFFHPKLSFGQIECSYEKFALKIQKGFTHGRKNFSNFWKKNYSKWSSGQTQCGLTTLPKIQKIFAKSLKHFWISSKKTSTKIFFWTSILQFSQPCPKCRNFSLFVRKIFPIFGKTLFPTSSSGQVELSFDHPVEEFLHNVRKNFNHSRNNL